MIHLLPHHRETSLTVNKPYVANKKLALQKQKLRQCIFYTRANEVVPIVGLYHYKNVVHNHLTFQYKSCALKCLLSTHTHTLCAVNTLMNVRMAGFPFIVIVCNFKKSSRKSSCQDTILQPSDSTYFTESSWAKYGQVVYTPSFRPPIKTSSKYIKHKIHKTSTNNHNSHVILYRQN